MSNKLFIGNIPFRIDESQLEETFAEAGKVESVKIITDRETGRSRGFGFVEMSNSDEAEAAIEKLDGRELEGRNIRVSIAREREQRGPRGNN